jgi:hypothetical protein
MVYKTWPLTQSSRQCGNLPRDPDSNVISERLRVCECHTVRCHQLASPNDPQLTIPSPARDRQSALPRKARIPSANDWVIREECLQTSDVNISILISPHGSPSSMLLIVHEKNGLASGRWSTNPRALGQSDGFFGQEADEDPFRSPWHQPEGAQ